MDTQKRPLLKMAESPNANVAEELKEFIARAQTEKSVGAVLCARVKVKAYDDYNTKVEATLRRGYTPAEYERFLDSLDIEYYSGYGSFHRIRGHVWFECGAWADRDEYDGAEWWALRRRPEPPPACQA